MHPLHTARLELRDFRPDDFAAAHAFASDPLVTRYTSWGPNSEEDTRAFLQRASAESAEWPRRDYSLAVVDRASGRLIGSCGLMTRRAGFREYEIGYVLHRDWWGRGLASEVVGGLLELGFGQLSAHRIYAQVDPENPPSSRLLLRLGFRQEGHLRRDLLVRGEWRDSLVFGMLVEEWRAGTAAGTAAAGAGG